MASMIKLHTDTALVILVLISVSAENVSAKLVNVFSNSSSTELTTWTEKSHLYADTTESEVVGFIDGRKHPSAFTTGDIQKEDHTKSLETLSSVHDTTNSQFDMTESDVQQRALATVPATSVMESLKEGSGSSEGMLYENTSRRFFINTGACSLINPRIIFAEASSTVSVMIHSDDAQNTVFNCSFHVFTHVDHAINLTVHKLESDFIGNFNLTIAGVQNWIDVVCVTDDEMLKTTNVSFFSDDFVRLTFKGYTPRQTTQVVTLHVDTKFNMKKLPFFMFSNTTGYIASPGNDVNEKYPNDYDGDAVVNIAHNESLLVSFSNFFVEPDKGGCRFDYLQLTLMDENKTWTECGRKSKVWMRVFRSTLRLYFHSNKCKSKPGFKMMFAIVPRSEEPELGPRNLLNCSVPSFHIFKSIISCNLVKECEDGEDEQHCGYTSNDCGDGMLDAGDKCYRVVRYNEKFNWFKAHQTCIQYNQRLATFITEEEYEEFRSLSPLGLTEPVFVGAQLVNRLAAVSTAALYRNIWQWVDGRTAFIVHIQRSLNYPACAFFISRQVDLQPTLCQKVMDETAFVCEFYKQGVNPQRETLADIGMGVNPNPTLFNVNVTVCEHSNHFTRDFLSCDFQADCGAAYSSQWCSAGDTTVPMFMCLRSRSSVHYTLVCDHVQHCSDNSDEDFCQFPECPATFTKCRNGQCIPVNLQCDKNLDCYDGSDEVCQMITHTPTFDLSAPLHIVYMDGKGSFKMERINTSDECPQTHFLCPRDLCLPVYLRCNGINDCPGHEDEVGCSSYTCPGFYRCRSSTVCLHPKDVCDSVPQCPEQDDELLCDLVCPDQCHCQGLAFVCSTNFSARSYPAIRYLDASNSNMTVNDVSNNILLVGLRLTKCRIRHLPMNTSLSNLRELDLSWNELTQIDMHHVHSLENLRNLVLKGNPLVQITNTETSRLVDSLLNQVDLSYTRLRVFSSSVFSNSPDVTLLNISFGKLRAIDYNGFKLLPRLQTIDLRGSPLTDYPDDLLRDLALLKVVHTENYKLCCEAMLPINFDSKNCHCPQDLLASCKDLLRSDTYRIFLWSFASLSMVGNVVSLGIRVRLQQEGESQGSFSVFVTNLSVADFFMGVYLAVIGTADLIFRGDYLWRDNEWKNSVACQIAGFLSLLSSEVSAFIVCLITLDRFLVLRFPFSRVHFTRRSAVIACIVGWMLGISLAGLPLLPSTAHWEFYSQTGICIPLPFIKSDLFLGYDYSFSVTILLNLGLFMLIAAGQAVIYWAVRTNSVVSSTKTRAREAAVARRLITIVVSDFLCWFPIGLLGVLAAMGTRIPGELSVAVAIFVLPFNSALNPFLYTFNVVMEKRRKAHNEKLMKRMETRLQKTNTTAAWQTSDYSEKAAVVKLVKARLNDKVLTPEDLLACSSSFTDKTAALRYVKFWLGSQVLSEEDLMPSTSALTDKVTPV